MSFLKSGFALSFCLLFLFGCAAEKPSEEIPRDLEIRIQDGALYTSESTVSLSLFARDAKECRFSDDGSGWSGWEAYATDKEWRLPPGDGPKQVFYQCRNGDNDSIPVSTTIYLDSTPPAITIVSPVQDNRYPAPFPLIFSVDDLASNTVDCELSFDGKRIDIGIISVKRQQNISVPAKAGYYTLEVSCSDHVHTTDASVPFSVADRPQVSIVINDGSDYTQNSTVTLGIYSPSAAECRLSRDTQSWTDWEPYSDSVEWELRKGDGARIVYAECRDAEGISSRVVQDSIIVDTKPPPYISVSIENGASWTDSREVSLGLYAYAASECRFSNDEVVWSPWEPYGRKKDWELSEGEGQKTVYYNCRKGDLEDIGTVTSFIRYTDIPDAAPSDLNIMINNGDDYASSEVLQLKLDAKGAYECRFREGDFNWTPWEAYQTSKMLSISGKDGAKTIYYQCGNEYGSSTVFDRIYLDRSPPSEVKSLKAIPSPFAVQLSWSPAIDTGSGVEYYFIFRKLNNGGWTWLGATDTLGFKDEGVVAGQTYQYKVRAVDFNRNEGKDSEVSAKVP